MKVIILQVGRGLDCNIQKIPKPMVKVTEDQLLLRHRSLYKLWVSKVLMLVVTNIQ